MTNRQQYVKLHDSTSIIITPSSGVPQGAILSPLLFSLFVNSAASVLRHARLLIFADDMKLFMRIHNDNDACLLQSDLNRLVLWSESLGLSLNISKCFKMSYFRTSSPITISYTIHDTPISNKSSVRDLGFYFLPNLSPRLHVQEICCKSLKLLGFIKRISSEFKLDQSIKILFCSLVRPILEYGSVIWDPHLSIESLMIERVQRKFLSFAAYSLKIHCPPHDYKPVLTALSLSNLADRRLSANINFLKKLLSHAIDSPTLLSQICFKVPSRPTRSSPPFLIPFSSSTYLGNSPINRLMRIANEDPTFNFP